MSQRVSLASFAALAVALLALLPPSRGAAGACAHAEARGAALAGVPAVVAADGGLIVRAITGLGGASADASFHVAGAGVLVLRSGHFLVGERQVTARLEPLARGLARLVPAEPLDGPAVWVGAGGTVSLRFEARPQELLEAPALSQASLRVQRRRVNAEDVDVTYRLGVTLRSDAPPPAASLLLFEGSDPVAVAHGALSAPSGRRVELASGGSCDELGWPFGWPSPRARVSAVYMDAWGRLSPRSGAVRLRR